MDCDKLRKSGIPEKQRLELALLISKFFKGNNFPPHKALYAELADFLANRLPELLCPPGQGKLSLKRRPGRGQQQNGGAHPAAQT